MGAHVASDSRRLLWAVYDIPSPAAHARPCLNSKCAQHGVETTRLDLQQFSIYPSGSHEPPSRMPFAQQEVADFMGDDMP
jgi:hypothetical protein